ncbi:MAG: DUF4259 domain-containing protein [Anaerolineae bacterium]
MGAQRRCPFDNDAALYWAHELGRAMDVSIVEAALEGVLATSGYLEAPCCSQATAAQEVGPLSLANP